MIAEKSLLLTKQKELDLESSSFPSFVSHNCPCKFAPQPQSPGGARETGPTSQ